MGNFAGGSEAPYYYSNPHRGRIPFGWGLPVPANRAAITKPWNFTQSVSDISWT
jgi:hypothetical protein